MAFGGLKGKGGKAAAADEAGPAKPGVGGFSRGAGGGGKGGGKVFNKGGGKGKPGKAAGKGSLWAGLKDPDNREPLLGVGDYRVCVESAVVNVHPQKGTRSFKGLVHVEATDGKCESEVGGPYGILEMLDGPAAVFGRPRAGAFIASASGFESVAAMDEFEPDGSFAGAMTGDANGYSESGATIVGRKMYVHVERGNNVTSEDGTPTGDYYRNCSYEAIGEDEQDVPAFEGVVQ